MQTWAKRGFRTAMVTGGLLMLGTGIASADEDVNPDRPASELDAIIRVPVYIDDNAIGTPLGSHAGPVVHRDVTISLTDLSGAVPMGESASRVAAPAVHNATRTAAPVVSTGRHAAALVDEARDQTVPLAGRTRPVSDRLGFPSAADHLSNLPSLADKADLPAFAADGGVGDDNHVNVDMLVPVDVSGNAIAVLGKARTHSFRNERYEHSNDVNASGAGGFIAGNVVDVDWALPVQVTDNAVAGLGTATASGVNAQTAATTGDIVTEGERGFLTGNVLAPQFATPVQVDGNAIAGGGAARALSVPYRSAEAGGYVLTSGVDSLAGGNAVPVPVAVPVKANGNATPLLGRADTYSSSGAHATAGATRTGSYGLPTYVETNGNPSVAAGNIVQPAVSGPAVLCGNAVGALGVANPICETKSTTEAGGTSLTHGAGAVASGAIAAPAVALPVEVFGNAAGAVAKTHATATNTVDSTAGGDAYTRGRDSILSGTTVSPAWSGPVDVFANAVAALGAASTTTANSAIVNSGGHSGTTGDNSIGGGNMGALPVALPVEVFGNVGAVAGSATAAVTEVKSSSAGGVANAADDNGLAAANLVAVPVASAAQVFGNGAGAVAVTRTAASADNWLTAGGETKATGASGVGSGNLAQAPVSLPFQAYGIGASGLARGTQQVLNETWIRSGGDASSDGDHAVVGGNIVSAPVGGAGQIFGQSVAALGLNWTEAESITATDAGGDTETSGYAGLGAGNVVSPQALPVVQTYATAVSALAGRSVAGATNETDAESGGDIETNGDRGVLSGNLLDVPAGVVAQPFGNAVAAVASKSFATGHGDVEGDVGGTSTTSGSAANSLSGRAARLPVGVHPVVYDVPVAVLARAFTDSTYLGDLEVAKKKVQPLHVPTGGMAPNAVPAVMPMGRSDDPTQGSFLGILSGLVSTNGLFGNGPVDAVVGQEAAQVLPAPRLPLAPANSVVTPFGGLGRGPVPGVSHTLPADLGPVTAPLPATGRNGFDGGRSGVSPQGFAPIFGDLADRFDATTVLPVIPAAPDRGRMPVPHGLNESSLDSTRAALADLFTTRPTR